MVAAAAVYVSIDGRCHIGAHAYLITVGNIFIGSHNK